MDKHLPFTKNKLNSAILISILVGAVPFSAQVMAAGICDNPENTVSDDQASTICTLESPKNLTIGVSGALDSVVVNSVSGNTQTITNAGTISSSTSQSIYVFMNGSVLIDNSGTISNSANKGIAINIAMNVSSAQIFNRATGTITGDIQLNANSTIFNSGTINGDVFLSSGTLNVQGGRIIGDVDSNSDSEVNFTGDFATEGGFDADDISIDSGVTLTLSHDFTGDVDNSGTLYAFGAGDTRIVNGGYTQQTSGTLKIDVASDSNYSKLDVNGDASFASNAKIDVNVIGAPALSIGSTINDIVSVEGEGSLVSDGTFSVSDNSALFNFTGQLDGVTIDLLIKGGSSSVLSSVQQNSNLPAAGVAKLIDQLIADGNNPTGLQSLITALGQIETEAEVSAAVNQLLPLLTGNQVIALVGAVGEISQVIQGRVEGLQGMSSGDAMPSEKQGEIFDDSYMWVKGFGSMADQGTGAGVTGFDADSSGLVIGLDGAPIDKDRIGVAFAYAQTDVDSKDNLNKVDINTYQLVGYGSHSLNDNTQFSYQANYGVHQSKGSRNISLVSNIAKSDFDSTSIGAGFGLLHSFTISDQLTVTPSIRNDYTYMDNDGYTETDAGALSLIVDSNDSEQWLFDLSSKAVYRLTESINLTGNLGASYDVINEQSTALSAFAGSPGNVFTTQGLKSDPWLYSAGIGLIMETDSGTKITARYDYSTGDDFDNQSISVKARWAF
jgi:uncharacterized protein with beta-barrel porin domain